VRNKAAKWVFAALVQIQASLPFPLLGIDSDNGSEFINYHLLRWCTEQRITFTRLKQNAVYLSRTRQPRPAGPAKRAS